MLIPYTSEIPTVLYAWSLKKEPLSGGAFPKKAIIGSAPPPRPPGYLLTYFLIIKLVFLCPQHISVPMLYEPSFSAKWDY